MFHGVLVEDSQAGDARRARLLRFRLNKNQLIRFPRPVKRVRPHKK